MKIYVLNVSNTLTSYRRALILGNKDHESIECNNVCIGFNRLVILCVISSVNIAVFSLDRITFT